MAAATLDADDRLTLEPAQPFDFDHSRWFLRGFLPCSGDHRCAGGALTTGGFAEGVPFVAEVRESTTSGLAVDVEWLDGPGDPDAVATWLRAFLSLDDDLAGLYRPARDDPAFGRVVEDLHGYHHVRFSTPFEAACWAALSQRTPMAVAKRLKRSVVETCGRIVERDGDEIRLFPTPQMVRDAAPAIDDVIEHDRKSKTLLAAADAFAAEDLAALDDEVLRERLAEVWGFGPWSSEFVTLRGFGRLSRIPRTERRLREAVADIYGLRVEEASDADLDRLSEPYRPLEGYWAHYVRVWAFRQSLVG